MGRGRTRAIGGLLCHQCELFGPENDMADT